MCLAELLGGTGRVFEEAVGSVLHSYSAIREAVEEGVDSCKAKLLQQDELTKGSRDAMLQMLVRGFHRMSLEYISIYFSIRLIVSTVRELCLTNNFLQDLGFRVYEPILTLLCPTGKA